MKNNSYGSAGIEMNLGIIKRDISKTRSLIGKQLNCGRKFSLVLNSICFICRKQ